jgi:hypothetical protein
MKNIYHDHLEQLRSIEIGESPALSMYVPLKWSDYDPKKIFSALLKVAEGLKQKNGENKFEINQPDWDRWIKQGTSTLALFHHAGVTHLIPIPIRMQPRVVVANSFHIKPILTAANVNIDALLLHFNEQGAHLYRVNSFSESLIDSYLPREVLAKYDWPVTLTRNSTREFLEFLNLEVKGSIKRTTKLFGITGADFSELRSESFWEKCRLPITYLNDSFKAKSPENGFSILRLKLSKLINDKHTQTINEILGSDSSFKDDESLKTLGEKILNKKINHLCVSLDDLQFGELDSTTGQITLNKNQKSTKDDDVFDDLVELAIDNGIKVSVVPKKYLPNGRMFLAS